MRCFQVSGAGEIRKNGLQITLDANGQPGVWLLGLACKPTRTTLRARLDDTFARTLSAFSLPDDGDLRILRCDLSTEEGLVLKPESADSKDDVLLLYPDEAAGQQIEFTVEGTGSRLYAACDFAWNGTTGWCALAKLTPGSELIARAPLPSQGVRYRRCWHLDNSGRLFFENRSVSLSQS